MPIDLDPDGVLRRIGAEEAGARARLTSVREELDAVVAASEHANLDDEHDPEGATVAYERARLSSAVEAETAALERLADARRRVAAGTYGRCGRCGDAIVPERLAALPAVTRCLRCATDPGG